MSLPRGRRSQEHYGSWDRLIVSAVVSSPRFETDAAFRTTRAMYHPAKGRRRHEADVCWHGQSAPLGPDRVCAFATLRGVGVPPLLQWLLLPPHAFGSSPAKFLAYLLEPRETIFC